MNNQAKENTIEEVIQDILVRIREEDKVRKG